MIAYWVFFFAVLACAAFPKVIRKQQDFVYAIVTLAIAVFVGLRHEVGGDWFNYARQFDRVAGLTFVESITTTKDLGYYPLGWLVAKLGGEIYALNFLCALVFAGGAVRLARDQPRPALALLAATPYLIIVVGMGYTRQSAAIGCVMFALVALGRERALSFAGWVILGAAFHKTAILILPIAGLATSKNRVWTSLWVAAASAASYWVFVHDVSDELWRNYVEADYAFASQGAGIRVGMNLLPAAVLLIWGSRILTGETERRLWRYLAWISLACVPMLWISPTGIDRLALYLIPLQLVVFGRITWLSNSISARSLLFICSCFYCFAVQFVWLNFANNAGSWVPYQSWLTAGW